MFAMPILSIISLLYRIAQGILWLGGLISGWKAASTLMGAGEGALLGGGGYVAGKGLAPAGKPSQAATGAQGLEWAAAGGSGVAGLTTAGLLKLVGIVGAVLTAEGIAMKSAGVTPGSWVTEEQWNAIYPGMTTSMTQKTLKGDTMYWVPGFMDNILGINQPYINKSNERLTNDSNVPEWARGISDIDPNNASDIYNWVYGTSNIDFNNMGSNFNRNMTSMKETTEDAAVAAAAFNNNLTFAGFQRESGLDNVTFKQENHFEINVQGSLDEKSTPNLFSGLTSLLAGRWS
jgi:hypothetical protein